MMTETARVIGVLAEAVGAAGLATLVVFTAVSFGHMPARISIQFDLAGTPGTPVGRGALWLPPIMGAGFFILMSFLNPAVSFPGGTSQDVSKAPVLVPVVFAEVLWLLFAGQWTIVRAAFGAKPNLIVVFTGVAVIVASAIAAIAVGLATEGGDL